MYFLIEKWPSAALQLSVYFYSPVHLRLTFLPHSQPAIVGHITSLSLLCTFVIQYSARLVIVAESTEFPSPPQVVLSFRGRGSPALRNLADMNNLRIMHPLLLAQAGLDGAFDLTTQIRLSPRSRCSLAAVDGGLCWG